MNQPLVGKTVLILIANGFEEMELAEPQRALLKAGATLRVASVDSGLVNGWYGSGWGHYFPVDAPIGDVLASDFDFLLLPGGERSVNKLKQSAHTRRIVNTFLSGDKPVATMGRGVELLALGGDKLEGRTVIGPVVSKETVEETGAIWAEEAVCLDKNIVSAVGADVMSVFLPRMMEAYGVVTETAETEEAQAA